MKRKIYKKIEWNYDNLPINLYFDKELEKLWIEKASIGLIINKKSVFISKLMSKSLIENRQKEKIDYKFISHSGKKRIPLYDVKSLDLIIHNKDFLDKLKEFEEIYISNYHRVELGKLYFKTGLLHLNEFHQNEEIFLNRNELINLFDLKNSNITLDKNIYYLDEIIKIGYKLENKVGEDFRMWVLSIISSILNNGYYINKEECLKDKKKVYEITNITNELSSNNELIDEEKTILYKSIITFNNNKYDAEYFINDLFSNAKKQIIILSRYMDDSIFKLLDSIKVNIILYTSKRAIITRFMSDKFMKDHILSIKKNYEIDKTYIIIDNLVYVLDVSIINIIKEDSKCTLLNINYNSIINNMQRKKA